jgi:phosphinothricin acetyltransferase
MIRPVRADDAAAICSIYNHYVESAIFTFEEQPIQVDEMRERIRKISAKHPYIVWEEESGEVNGFAYINTWKEREAYRFSAEVSVYIRNELRGRGMGRALMEKLLEEVRKTEIHSLVSGIVLPNDPSVILHEKFGFVKIGLFREIGFKLNRWLDVGYWELILK